MMKHLVLSFALCLAIAHSAHSQCRTDEAPPRFTTQHRDSFSKVLNLELNDYGRIHEDADNPACAEKALYALSAKVRNTLWVGGNPATGTQYHTDERELYPTGPYQGAWEGWHVAAIFSAAQRLGANGWATKDLDVVLQAVRDSYSFNATCEDFSANTCKDDYAGGAVAHAWIAAYEFRRGRSASAHILASRAYLKDFFRTVCIDRSNLQVGDFVRCDGDDNTLLTGDVTYSLNHGIQQPPYGFGLMTSVASALLGLGVAGAPTSLASIDSNVDTQLRAVALLREAQGKVVSSSSGDNATFDDNCLNVGFTQQPNVRVISTDAPCGGVIPGQPRYEPEMFVLKRFYEGVVGHQFVGGEYSFAGQYDFDADPSEHSFHGVGRKLFYVTHSSDWLHDTAPVSRYLPFDNHDPIGVVESISPTGWITGWSCDKDFPTGSNRVDFYHGDPVLDPEQAINYASVRAEQPSGTTVRDACGGGNHHRFSLQLPSEAVGKPVSAWGLDYTWYGVTRLACQMGIIKNPASYTLPAGSVVTLTVEAASVGPLSYQWYRGMAGDTSQMLTGETSASFTIPPVTATTRYWVRVTGCGGTVDSTTSTITLGSCPSLSVYVSPSSVTILQGESLTLTATANSINPLTWQWYKDDGWGYGPIPNATGPSITVSPSSFTRYSVVVGNGCTSVGSNTAYVTVSKEYAIALRTYYWNYVGAEGGGGAGVHAVATAPYQWERFILRDLDGGYLVDGDFVTLRSHTGHYVVAEWCGGEGRTVNADRVAAGDWETFQIKNMDGGYWIGHGSNVALKACWGSGYYVVAEYGGINGGGPGAGEVNCDRTIAGAWETFEISWQ
jgi:hypothetical protein